MPTSFRGGFPISMGEEVGHNTIVLLYTADVELGSETNPVDWVGQKQFPSQLRAVIGCKMFERNTKRHRQLYNYHPPAARG